MRDQRLELRARTVGFERHPRAHVGEADRLVGQIAGSPYAGDVEIAFQLDLELEHGDALRHRVGVDADREA